jgi:hypothetical protein
VQVDVLVHAVDVVLPEAPANFTQVAVRCIHHGAEPVATIIVDGGDLLFQFGDDFDAGEPGADIVSVVVCQYHASTGWIRYSESKGPGPLDDGGA